MVGTRQGSSDDSEPPGRPTVLVLMAEYGGVFLWDRSPGPVGLGSPSVLDPVELGLPSALVERLAAWDDASR